MEEERILNSPQRKFSCHARINIEFQNLEYTVREPKSSSGYKKVLNKVNGTFCSGDLTAILGASGSGKTTLLNILAGYVTDGVSGIITVNGRPRNMKTFKKVSCYIAQEDCLRPNFSVCETMRIASSLKLGSEVNEQEKQNIIYDILNTLGLKECYSTRTEHLSGGERKRVSVALELISNRPVMFLDEPTTGLDYFAAKKCVHILRQLSREKKTIICSIHQPSQLIFNMFHQVYFLHNGLCIYNGHPTNIENYLSSVGLTCPLTWNLSDYLIETSYDGEVVQTLIAASENGRVCNKNEDILPFKENLNEFHCISSFPTSYFTQVRILLNMMFLQILRNKKALLVHLINHSLVGAVTGGIFFNSGRSASSAVENFFFYLTVVMFFLYTYAMTSVLLFPTEVQIFRKEHFNRWYSLKAYYVAVMIRNIPLMVFYGSIFNCIVYLLTGQRMDLYHFALFSLTTFLVATASEAFGILIGSLFSVLLGSVAAPVLLAPLIMFSLYGIGDGQRIHPFMETVISFSYVRSSFTALCRLMLANQPPLECLGDVYCHYRDTDVLLRDMGMENKSFHLEIMYICVFMIICRILGYMALKYRLKNDFEAKLIIVILIFKRYVTKTST